MLTVAAILCRISFCSRTRVNWPIQAVAVPGHNVLCKTAMKVLCAEYTSKTRQQHHSSRFLIKSSLLVPPKSKLQKQSPSAVKRTSEARLYFRLVSIRSITGRFTLFTLDDSATKARDDAAVAVLAGSGGSWSVAHATGQSS